jgi:hypothetical protein
MGNSEFMSDQMDTYNRSNSAPELLFLWPVRESKFKILLFWYKVLLGLLSYLLW